MEITYQATLAIRSEEDIVLVRRAVRDLAMTRRFDPFATAAITTASSELARNVWVHAGQGEARLEVVEDRERTGIRLTFEDQGPGIPNVAAALAGGLSTAGSLGLGLSGSARLVDDLQIQSAPGEGTRITIVKWKRA